MKKRIGLHRAGDLFLLYDASLLHDVHTAIRTLLEALVKRLGKQEEAGRGGDGPSGSPPPKKGVDGQGQPAAVIAMMDRVTLNVMGSLVEALLLGCMLARELTVSGCEKEHISKLTWSTDACKAQCLQAQCLQGVSETCGLG